MRSYLKSICLLFIAFFLAFPNCCFSQGSIKLPEPRKDGGKPLMQCLQERRSTRSFASKDLPPQVLSDLLWAAYGVNRPDSGGRTAPSAKNRQEIDIYVAKKDGLFLYDAADNELEPVLLEDIRYLTGEQGFVEVAPVNLIFVANHTKMEGMTEGQKEFYATVDTGFISQNVYLFCASEGLATVVRGMFNSLSLAKAMRLRASQRLILTQTVGYAE